MGFFSRKSKIEEPPEQPQIPEVKKDSGVSIFSSKSTAGTVVTERSAIQIEVVYSCIRVISENFASLPVHIYKRDSRGSIIQYEHPLHVLLHDEPNPDMTSYNFRQAMMYNLLIHGNAYAQIQRNRLGRPIALYPLMPHKMDVWRNSKGEL